MECDNDERESGGGRGGSQRASHHLSTASAPHSPPSKSEQNYEHSTLAAPLFYRRPITIEQSAGRALLVEPSVPKSALDLEQSAKTN